MNSTLRFSETQSQAVLAAMIEIGPEAWTGTAGLLHGRLSRTSHNLGIPSDTFALRDALVANIQTLRHRGIEVRVEGGVLNDAIEIAPATGGSPAAAIVATPEPRFGRAPGPSLRAAAESRDQVEDLGESGRHAAAYDRAMAAGRIGPREAARALREPAREPLLEDDLDVEARCKRTWAEDRSIREEFGELGRYVALERHEARQRRSDARRQERYQRSRAAAEVQHRRDQQLIERARGGAA